MKTRICTFARPQVCVIGVVHAEVVGDCVIWKRGQGLLASVLVGDAVNKDFGGNKLEPDVAIFAFSDGANRMPRCLIESR
jgi:hypothetical protein